MSQVSTTRPAWSGYSDNAAVVKSKLAVCAPFALRPEITNVGTVPLLFSSPVDLPTMVSCIIGELAERFDCFTNKWAKVVRKLFSHIRPDSNWVWPSQEQLAMESGTSERTVQRVYNLLYSLGVKAVRGDELYSGPGPHDLDRAEWRNPRGTVPTLDLSALAALLPAPLVQLFTDFIAGKLDSTMLQQVPVRPSLPDPFSESSQSINTPQANTFRRQTPEPPDFVESDGGITPGEATFPIPVCNVFIESVNKDEKQESVISRSDNSIGRVQTPKLAAVYRRESGAGVVCLVGIGVWKSVARKIVKQEGDVFAERLAAYARWRERRQELRETKAAYAYAVFRDWGPESAFPDDFRATEEYRVPSARSKPLEPRKAKPATVPPVSSPPDAPQQAGSAAGLGRVRAVLGALKRGKGKHNAS